MNASTRAPSRGAAPGRERDLSKIVEEVSHLLPAQAPIRRFVHHNTLHHFQHLPFEEAVVQAGALFGCQPYPSEEFFATQVARGRITERDLEAVLALDDGLSSQPDSPLPFGGWNRSDFRRFRLGHVVAWPGAAEVRFQVEEGEALSCLRPDLTDRARESFLDGGLPAERLAALWQALCKSCAPRQARQAQEDGAVEQVVHSLLIRFCGAYLDQGVSYWPMPQRDGLWGSFLELYGQTSPASAPWLSGLSGRLSLKRKQGVSAESALAENLDRLGVPRAEWRSALQRRGLALRGWAGMISQMEQRPDLAPIKAPPVRLLDYFAILTELEAQARGHAVSSAETTSERPNYELLFEAFGLAQLAGLGPTALATSEQREGWLRAVEQFSELERRRLLFWAYERRYRVEILDGVKNNSELGEYRPAQEPLFQAVFCMDDREESLRRHLEEIETQVQTLGMAGFFGVRMAYRGWNDTRALPLCPANATPEHLVLEQPLDERPNARPLGHLQQTLRSSRNGVVSGGLLATGAGLFAGVSLVGRTLAPGLFQRATAAIERTFVEPPRTRLKVERQPHEPKNGDGLWEGFTVSEMAAIVGGSLRMMGALKLAPLFLIVGHGSSSVNNPHEAAYDCGATGGGKGGPNARAFAAMANHPEVRQMLAEQGLVIPPSTWFIGSFHNTCNDSMDYYDLDLVPETMQPAVARMREALAKACVMDAHERCRRFASVDLEVSPEQAFRHVQARAVTLAQPRPECGHCTNSIAIIGRRERTRGLYLDRRAFLVSYDPTTDPEWTTLRGILESVGPVGAGINLEYYFSSVDSAGYGCGTKLPHNITGMLGVMDGHASDLRTGLPWQMVEIHEPMRLLVIVEATLEGLAQIMEQSPGVRELVGKGWIQLVAWSPDNSDLWTYQNGAFVAHQSDSKALPVVDRSRDYYKGQRDHLPPARIQSAYGG